MGLVDVVPVMKVDDLERAVAFYAQLGFAETFRWGEPPFYAGLTIGPAGESADTHVHVNVSEDSPGKGELYLTVDDVDAIHDRLTQADIGIEIVLQDQPYGMRDFSVRDPAGNFLTIGSPLPEAAPAAS